MNLDNYFDLVLHVMQKHAIYSGPHRGPIISRIRAQVILLEHMNRLDRPFVSPPELLNEGVRRKLWEMSVEQERKMLVLMVK